MLLGRSKDKKYRNKNIRDIAYTVGSVSPETKRIELKPSDGSGSIVVTYSELRERYEEI